MTPKEKAKELIKEFKCINYDLSDSENHKECTMVVVDEIIEELKREPYTNYERIIFWKAVKIELNKL